MNLLVSPLVQFCAVNPHTVVKKLHPNPVLRGPNGPQGLYRVNDFRLPADPAQLDEG